MQVGAVGAATAPGNATPGKCATYSGPGASPARVDRARDPRLQSPQKPGAGVLREANKAVSTRGTQQQH